MNVKKNYIFKKFRIVIKFLLNERFNFYHAPYVLDCIRHQ